MKEPEGYPHQFSTDDNPGIIFLPHPQCKPKKVHLGGNYLIQLRRQYETNKHLPANHPDLLNIDTEVIKFVRCREDNLEYQSREYSASNAARLNYLACLELEIDLNENFSYRARPERIVTRKHYAEIEFFAVHTFQGKDNTLVFFRFRKQASCTH